MGIFNCSLFLRAKFAVKQHLFRNICRWFTRLIGAIVLLVLDTVVDDEDTERADVVIAIRELDDVLMKDVGDKIAASGK